MADILIRGIEMPDNVEGCEAIIRIQPNGEVLNAHKFHIGATAIPLPEGHGRLGDLETAEAILHNKAFDLAGTSAEYNALNWALRQIKALPTIIEADLEWKMKNCCCFSNTDHAEGGGEE